MHVVWLLAVVVDVKFAYQNAKYDPVRSSGA